MILRLIVSKSAAVLGPGRAIVLEVDLWHGLKYGRMRGNGRNRKAPGPWIRSEGFRQLTSSVEGGYQS
jgi:hypothetical protein